MQGHSDQPTLFASFDLYRQIGYGCLVDFLGRAGRLREAYEIVKVEFQVRDMEET
jgi:pentatricopeptide repeat protein